MEIDFHIRNRLDNGLLAFCCDVNAGRFTCYGDGCENSGRVLVDRKKALALDRALKDVEAFVEAALDLGQQVRVELNRLVELARLAVGGDHFAADVEPENAPRAICVSLIFVRLIGRYNDRVSWQEVDRISGQSAEAAAAGYADHDDRLCATCFAIAIVISCMWKITDIGDHCRLEKRIIPVFGEDRVFDNEQILVLEALGLAYSVHASSIAQRCGLDDAYALVRK